jgi:hypothetical protein
LNSPLHSSPPFLSLDSWNSFNRSHFCIYIHVYTLFASCSSSCSFPLHFPSSTSANPPIPKQNKFCPSIFLFCRRKSIKNKTRNMMFY